MDKYLIKLGTYSKTGFVFKGLTKKNGHSYRETLKTPSIKKNIGGSMQTWHN